MNLHELIQKAEKAYKDQQFEDAIVLYKQAIVLDSNNARLYSELGISYYHLNNKEKALENLNKAIDLEPNNSYRYSSRGYIKGVFKMLDEAILDYKKAIELDPSNAITFNNLGLLQEQKGWAKMAKSNFDKADSLEGILKEQNTDFPNTDKKNEIKKQSLNSSIPLHPMSKIEVVKSVFTKKEVFKEFINFIRNGFKLNNDGGSNI